MVVVVVHIRYHLSIYIESFGQCQLPPSQFFLDKLWMVDGTSSHPYFFHPISLYSPVFNSLQCAKSEFGNLPVDPTLTKA